MSSMEMVNSFDKVVIRCRVYEDDGKGGRMEEVGWSLVRSDPVRNASSMKVNSDDNREMFSYRAGARLRRLVMSICADHMITLTWRANITDIGVADKAFARFVRIIRGKKSDWRYVAVPERQHRGSWHWHVAVRGRQDVNLIRSVWLRVTGEGGVDVRGGWNAVDLSGYLAKSFRTGELCRGRHRYRSSKGIEIPERKIEFLASRENLIIARRIAAEVAGEGGQAVGGPGYGWAASWSNSRRVRRRGYSSKGSGNKMSADMRSLLPLTSEPRGSVADTGIRVVPRSEDRPVREMASESYGVRHDDHPVSSGRAGSWRSEER